MTKEYKIWITGDYDILVLSPEMIALLIKRVKNSNTREVVIPAEEILPQGYAEYLIRVLGANMGSKQPDADLKEVTRLIAEQIKKLSVNQQKCFGRVNMYECQYQTQFNISTSKIFYMLVKQGVSSFTYVYKDLDDKEIRLTLLYQ